METYNDIYLRVRKSLKNAGIEAADIEAKYIVTKALGISREHLLAMGKIYATDKEKTGKIEEYLSRRLKNEPLAYILGEWEFCALNIIVNNNVLIPRPDTEILAYESVKLIKRKVWKTRVLDLCTGSGCLGLTIASQIPACRVVLADISEEVLAVCRQNMLALGLTRNTTATPADALAAPPGHIGVFDAIICNPPYIPKKDIETLDSSVRDFEPLSALDGGPDGLDFYRSVAGKWKSVLKPGGHLAFECGAGQADEVKRILSGQGFGNILTYKDYKKIDRVITAMKNER